MTTDDLFAIVVFDPDDRDARSEVADLLDRAERETGNPPLSDASLLAWHQRDVAMTGLLQRGPGGLVGYAQLGWRDGPATIEIVVRPDADRSAVRGRLLEAALAEARSRGATEVRYWQIHHGGDGDEPAMNLGFSVERDLFQMRVPLPLHLERREPDPGFVLRPFRPDRDEQAWLEINNRAFSAHPEQGRWELSDLLAREALDWFDPNGFVICEHDGTIAGSCWTKVHATRGLGEIYVISVNPDFQGHGLGRLLTVAGLDRLAERVSVGMLYVDASNEPALGLYRSLGFTLDHVERCYLLR